MPEKAGATTSYRPDRKRPRRLTKAEAARIDSLTDEELTAAAESDPDNLPLDDRTLTRLRRPIDVKAIRQGLKLTQAEFAREFGLELRTVQDWEQGRVQPTGAARTLLRIIENDPEAVQQALK
jgi:putative transcriptional regulator